MTRELYEEVKDEIPEHIGVYVGGSSVKRAKKQELSVDEQILKDSMIRSLYREAEKGWKSNDGTEIHKLQRQINYEKSQYEDYYDRYWSLYRRMQDKYGTRFDK